MNHYYSHFRLGYLLVGCMNGSLAALSNIMPRSFFPTHPVLRSCCGQGLAHSRAPPMRPGPKTATNELALHSDFGKINVPWFWTGAG